MEGKKIIVMRADWYETRTPRRQTAFLPPVTTIWILQGSQCSPHFFLPKLNSIASAGWFKMQIRYSTNAPEDHNIILNPGFKMSRLKWSTVLEGNRITLEHSPKHHLGTQPFLIALEHKMIHLVFPQPTHKTSNLLTGAAVWKPRAFQSDPSIKKRRQSQILSLHHQPSSLLLLFDLGIHCAVHWGELLVTSAFQFFFEG